MNLLEKFHNGMRSPMQITGAKDLAMGPDCSVVIPQMDAAREKPPRITAIPPNKKRQKSPYVFHNGREGCFVFLT